MTGKRIQPEFSLPHTLRKARPEVYDGDWFRGGLEGILAHYVRARTQEHLDASHPLWRLAKHLQSELEADALVRERPFIKVCWSFGQGAWARIPWIALLDTRVTRVTSAGVYVIYLFREDMSGVYATLNQGITKEKERLGARAGLLVIRERSVALRRSVGALERVGFSLSRELDLHTKHTLGKDYQQGTIAHRLYDAAKLPKTRALLIDLRMLLDAYATVVATQLRPDDVTE